MKPLEITAEEVRVIETGRSYAELKGHPAWRKLVSWCVSYCNDQLEALQKGKELEPIHTARVVDRWRASEEFYQALTAEVESAIRLGREKEAELKEAGINTVLMPDATEQQPN